VLPPGQSGYVSLAGTASGTGSPHLTDQTPLFTSFRFKSAMFDQPGAESSPRAGVKIVRDGYGVPAITGASDYDAWWGVGYAIAEDRLFQLELFKRAATGRLAEILGPDYLDDDLIARRDYYTAPEIQAMGRRMPAALFHRVEAYRDGINAWIAKARSDPTLLPGEFAALGVQLSDWTSDDSLRIGVLLARTIPSGDGAELDNARALQSIGPKAFSKLLPLRTPGRITTVPRSAGLFPSQPGRTRKQERAAYKRSQRFVKGLPLPPRTSASAAAVRRPVIHTGGSYMWAIRAGKRRAYLFNGPQLGYSIPELFVEFELHSPTQRVRGVSAAGVPIVGIGHNSNVAWGFTSGLSDEDDLYAERLIGSEAYRFKGKRHAMSCRNETFTYRTPPTSLPDTLGGLLGGQTGPPAGSKTERICRTLHGPVQARAGGRAFARRYTTWGRELETIVGLSALNDAKNVNGVDRAMRKVTWNENVIAADSRGNIGYWHPGLHPLRPLKYDERLPYPGTGEAEWRGLLNRKRTPHVINPKQGYLFNWNNMPSVGWTNGDAPARERTSGKYHRSAWLRREVRAVKRHPSYARHRGIDRTNGTIAQQRPLFSPRLKQARRRAHGRARAVLAELARWNGSYNEADGRNTVAPGVAIWEEFKSQAEQVAFRAFRPGAGLLSDGASSSHQFDITNGEAYGLRTLSLTGLSRAATRADAALTKRFGTTNIAAWREPRRMYEISAMGAASPPDLPFFDRGTWEQSVAVGP
jgi:penicillin amidase